MKIRVTGSSSYEKEQDGIVVESRIYSPPPVETPEGKVWNGVLGKFLDESEANYPFEVDEKDTVFGEGHLAEWSAGDELAASLEEEDEDFDNEEDGGDKEWRESALEVALNYLNDAKNDEIKPNVFSKGWAVKKGKESGEKKQKNGKTEKKKVDEKQTKTAQDSLYEALVADESPKDKTLAEHDKERHPDGFNPETDSCKFRDELKKETETDKGDEVDVDRGREEGIEVDGEGKGKKPLVSAEDDAEYLEAVKKGDMEKAAEMVREAAARAFPNTKVVGEDGKPKIVYHGGELKEIYGGEIYTSDDKNLVKGYGKTYSLFANITNPKVIDADGNMSDDLYGETLEDENAMGVSTDRVVSDTMYDPNSNHDGVIFRNVVDNATGDADGLISDVFVPFNMEGSQIKSADPVTYDDDGNVIPLSRRFDEGNDIRGDVSVKGVSLEETAKKEVPEPEEEKPADTSKVYEGLSKKKVEEYRNRMAKKRPDLDSDLILTELGKIKDKKIQGDAFAWVMKGAVRLPEDLYKVEQARELATKAKRDPMQWDTPQACINELTGHGHKISEKPITVEELKKNPLMSDYRDEGYGVETFQVDDSREGQQLMRQVIDTHWGKDANPWCLLARHGEPKLEQTEEAKSWIDQNYDSLYDELGLGNERVKNHQKILESEYEKRTGKKARELVDRTLDDAWRFWQQYNALPKRVAFKDGKLLAFMATEKKDLSTDELREIGTPSKKDLPTEYSEYEKEYGEWNPGNVTFQQFLEWYHYDEYDRWGQRHLPEEWWDRQDSPHEGIPLGKMKIPEDENGCEGESEIRKGKITFLTRERTFPDGRRVTFGKDGDVQKITCQDKTEITYKDGRLEFLTVPFKINGTHGESGRQLVGEDLSITEDGEIHWEKNGQPFYEREKDGHIVSWRKDGTKRYERMPDGTERMWDNDGKLIGEKKGTDKTNKSKTTQDELVSALVGDAFVSDESLPQGETLQEHDRKHHKKGFNPETDSCKFRDELKKETETDKGDEVDVDRGREEGIEVDGEGNGKKPLVTPEEDKEYLDAVEKGDIEKADRLLRNVARRAGFLNEVYHQTNADFTQFDTENRFNSHGGAKEYLIPNGIYTKNTDEHIGVSPGKQMHLFHRTGNFLSVNDRKDLSNFLRKALVGFDSLEDELNSFREKRFAELKDAPDLAIAVRQMQDEWEEKANGIKEKVTEFFRGSEYDGIKMSDDHGIEMTLLFRPNDVKSADSVTYDDDGNVIPLSRRFDDGDDIRGDVSGKGQETDSVSSNQPLVTPEEDKAYMEAVERDDMETASRMLREVAARAFPNTKVVDEDGLPQIQYHYGRLGIDHYLNYDDDNDPFIPNGLTHFGTRQAAADREVATSGAFDADEENSYGTTSYFLNIENPMDTQDGWGMANDKKNGANIEHEGYDGNKYENVIEGKGSVSWVAYKPSQIKSADPVTWDDKGHVVPLSKRFDSGDDIRGDVSGGTSSSVRHSISDDGEEFGDSFYGEVYPDRKQSYSSEFGKDDAEDGEKALDAYRENFTKDGKYKSPFEGGKFNRAFLERAREGKGSETGEVWDDESRAAAEAAGRVLSGMLGGVTFELSDKPYGESSNGDSRKSIGGIFTGSSADYDKPSLLKIGTGEGNQVYGWGLYGSKQRGVAQTYADMVSSRHGYTGYSKSGRLIKANEGTGDVESDAATLLALYGSVENAKKEAMSFPNGKAILRELEEHGNEYKDEWPHSIIYEQTFFTNREPGDESHLLNWFEPTSEMNLYRINEQLKNEGIDARFTNKVGGYELVGKDVRQFGERSNILKKAKEAPLGMDLYARLTARLFGSEAMTSQFLARAGIDGVKYPVDSYGGKTIKNGDEVGWNYVSFRDDNIKVDHKWVDGEQRFFRNSAGKVVGEYNRATNKITLYPGAKIKDVVHEYSHGLWQFAEQEAKAGRDGLQKKLHQIAHAAPEKVKEAVGRSYYDQDPNVVLEECFTHEMARRSEKNKSFAEAIKTASGKKWYKKAWGAIKDTWKGLASKLGFNKADTSRIDDMTSGEAADFILTQMAQGKKFGDVNPDDTPDGGGKGETRKSIVGEKGASNLKIGHLDEAKKMAEEGADKNEILQKTGWWKAKDGLWRIEIPDLKITKKKMSQINSYLNEWDIGGSGILDISLGELIKGSKVLKAYPEFNNLVIKLVGKGPTQMLKPKCGGFCDMPHNNITIYDCGTDAGDWEYTISVLEHELQHAIQSKEGFARGGAPGYEELSKYSNSEYDDYTKTLESSREDVFAKLEEDGLDYREWVNNLDDDKYAELRDEEESSGKLVMARKFLEEIGNDKYEDKLLRPLEEKLKESRGKTTADMTGQQIYHNLLGEVEARNAALRHGLDMEDRRDTMPPWDTEDVPEEKQIVRH